VNPEQIEIVVDTWRDACRDADRLHEALRARLPAPVPGPTHDAYAAPDARAGWIIEAVSRLSPVIGRPTRFTESAGDLIARRGAVTMSERGADQSALLGALGELLGALDEDAQRAWSLALKLFEETVAATCLDPFGGVPAGAHGDEEPR
jgi:hypothetical protein